MRVNLDLWGGMEIACVDGEGRRKILLRVAATDIEDVRLVFSNCGRSVYRLQVDWTPVSQVFGPWSRWRFRVRNEIENLCRMLRR